MKNRCSSFSTRSVDSRSNSKKQERSVTKLSDLKSSRQRDKKARSLWALCLKKSNWLSITAAKRKPAVFRFHALRWPFCGVQLYVDANTGGALCSVGTCKRKRFMLPANPMKTPQPRMDSSSLKTFTGSSANKILWKRILSKNIQGLTTFYEDESFFILNNTSSQL